MKTKINRKFLGGMLLISFLFLLAMPVFAEGIVPCGHDRACTLCDLIVGIKKIFDYGLKIIIVITLACATFAGVMYVVSSGSEKQMESAKSFLSSSLIGLAIVLGSWLIVNTTIAVLMPTKSDLGTGKASWYQFGDIDCSSSTSGTTGSLEITSPDATSSETNSSVSSLTVGTVGTQYTLQPFSVTGGSGNYTWSATGLPPGLAIDSSTGVISGIATVAGTYIITVTANDNGSVSLNSPASLIFRVPTALAVAVNGQKSVSKQFQLVIKAAGSLIINTVSLPNGTVGTYYAFNLASNRGDQPCTWSATGLPVGLNIDRTTGFISGTPTVVGTSKVNISVALGDNNATKQLSLIIAAIQNIKKETTCINSYCSGTNSKLTEVRNAGSKSNADLGKVCCDGDWWADTRGDNWSSSCNGKVNEGIKSGGWYICNNGDGINNPAPSGKNTVRCVIQNNSGSCSGTNSTITGVAWSGLDQGVICCDGNWWIKASPKMCSNNRYVCDTYWTGDCNGVGNGIQAGGFYKCGNNENDVVGDKPSITVLSPNNKGDSFPAGSVIPLRWQTSGFTGQSAKIKINLENISLSPSSRGGSSGLFKEASNIGSEDLVTNADTLPGRYFIRVIACGSASNNCVSDDSEPFNIR